MIVERDSQLVFNALKNTSLVTSFFAMLITDCQLLVSSIAFLSFSFVKRFVNSAVHAIARATSFLLGLVVWDDIPSGFLIQSLNLHLN